jgi:hypothetical protein
MTDLQRHGGIAAIVGAVAGIVGDVIVHSSDAVVATDRVSYPLSSTAWAWWQVFFACTQAMLAVGVVALVRSDLVAPSRRRTIMARFAGVGVALTVPGELLLIAAAGSTNDSTRASLVSTVFGVIVLVADAGLIGYGVLALRQHAQPRLRAALPLVLGVFHLAVLTPVSLAAGFASGASQAVFAVSYLLYATIGLTLWRTAATPVPLVATRRERVRT